MQAAAHAQRNTVGGLRIGERLLQLERGAHRVERVVEGGVHAVAGHLDDRAAMRSTAERAMRVVARERRLHALRLALPQPGAAFDVGEEKGRDVQASLRCHTVR